MGHDDQKRSLTVCWLMIRLITIDAGSLSVPISACLMSMARPQSHEESDLIQCVRLAT
jgi:hypothetical protein